MTENRRIFLSGAVIAGLLLLIPPYLSFIGVSVGLENDTEGSLSETVLSQDNHEQTNYDLESFVLQGLTPGLQKEDSGLISFRVQTEKLNLSLSNEGGGH